MNDWLDYKGSGSVISHAMKPNDIAFKPSARIYDTINSELDALYSSISEVQTAKSNWAQATQQFNNAARTLRAKTTLLKAALIQKTNTVSDIRSKIERNGTILSALQKTALSNKLKNIDSKIWGTIRDVNRGAIFNTNDLDSLIGEINSTSSAGRR